MNWLQTNGIIYLPVVVKGVTRVGGNARRGASSKHDTFTQCCNDVVSASQTVAQQCTSIGERLLFATSWKGTVLLYCVYKPAYQTR